MALPCRSRQEHSFELGYDLRDPIRALERGRACAGSHVLQVQHQTDEGARRHRLHGGARLGKRARPEPAEHLCSHPLALGCGRFGACRGPAAEPAPHDPPLFGKPSQAFAHDGGPTPQRAAASLVEKGSRVRA